MELTQIGFMPLVNGEAIGDPELGGWRPLPRRIFLDRNHEMTSASILMNIEDAVAAINFQVHYKNLKRAIGVLAEKLALAPHSFIKGGEGLA